MPRDVKSLLASLAHAAEERDALLAQFASLFPGMKPPPPERVRAWLIRLTFPELSEALDKAATYYHKMLQLADEHKALGTKPVEEVLMVQKWTALEVVKYTSGIVWNTRRGNGDAE